MFMKHAYALLLVLVALYGCGGSEATPEEIDATPPSSTQPVNCKTSPTLCR